MSDKIMVEPLPEGEREIGTVYSDVGMVDVLRGVQDKDSRNPGAVVIGIRFVTPDGPITFPVNEAVAKSIRDRLTRALDYKE